MEVRHRGRPRKVFGATPSPSMPSHGEVIVAYDGKTYRCQTSLSTPLRSSALQQAEKQNVRLQDIWLYFAIAKDAQVQEDGKPVVWLAPDELELDIDLEQKVKLAYRRYLRNNLLRQRRTRRRDRRILLPDNLAYDAATLLAEPTR